MYAISTLWLPIVLSAIAVFIVSSLIHMATPWHKGDYQRVPDEDGVMRALRPFAIPPGDYLMPRPASTADMRSAEYQARRSAGPVAIMTVMPAGMPSMGKFMGFWFVYLVVVSAAVAMLASATVVHGADSHRVFHVVAFTTFLAHSAAIWPLSIWYQRSWGTAFRSTVDGLIYALVTGGVFVWCWPGVMH